MTTNKPGAVTQQPLYGCTSCYEECTYPADHLRVYDNECWCDLCWDERRWDFPDQPDWSDLEPYTPALQAECALLREQLDVMTEYKVAAHQLIGIPASVGISEPIEGFAKRPQDIMPAVRDMALRIELLEHQAAERERLLAESRANDQQAMAYLSEVRALVGADDFPDMVRRCEKLRAECEKLRTIICDIKSWDCDVMGGCLSLPLELRQRMQQAIDKAMQEAT